VRGPCVAALCCRQQHWVEAQQWPSSIHLMQQWRLAMPAESRDLTNTVVAITGASSGIGAASARLLLEARRWPCRPATVTD
jgi:hypothetical protein